MKENAFKKKKINNFFKITMIIQALIFIVLLCLLSLKIYDYNFSGNTLTSNGVVSKCDISYKCKCPKLIGKCKCIYFDENDNPKKIKCNNY